MAHVYPFRPAARCPRGGAWFADACQCGIPVLAGRSSPPFPARSHDFLAAFSLTTIAIAYLVYQASHRPPLREMAKAILLTVAFLFWAANQLWPESAQATLLNDIAIALFVVDVFLVIVGWPASAADELFAGTEGERGQLRKEESPE